MAQLNPSLPPAAIDLGLPRWSRPLHPLIDRVAGGVDRLVAQSYQEGRMEELNLAAVFRETLAAVGFDLPEDVIAHIVELDHSAYSKSITVEPEVLSILERLRGLGRTVAAHAVRLEEAV